MGLMATKWHNFKTVYSSTSLQKNILIYLSASKSSKKNTFQSFWPVCVKQHNFSTQMCKLIKKEKKNIYPFNQCAVSNKTLALRSASELSASDAHSRIYDLLEDFTSNLDRVLDLNRFIGGHLADIVSSVLLFSKKTPNLKSLYPIFFLFHSTY